MKFVFKKAYKFEGKEYNEIDLDLEGLTGEDVRAARKEYAADGGFSVIPATDWDFCICVAARAAKQPQAFFSALPANEYCRLAQAVSNFLLV